MTTQSGTVAKSERSLVSLVSDAHSLGLSLVGPCSVLLWHVHLCSAVLSPALPAGFSSSLLSPVLLLLPPMPCPSPSCPVLHSTDTVLRKSGGRAKQVHSSAPACPVLPCFSLNMEQ